jgi:hypothetical protein
MSYPQRIIRKGTILIDTTKAMEWDDRERETDMTGITDRSWSKLAVVNMVEPGVYLIGGGMRYPEYVDWEKLPLYRVLRVTEANAKYSIYRYEHWFLHKINVAVTIKEYGRLRKTDPTFYRAPLAHEWRIR